MWQPGHVGHLPQRGLRLHCPGVGGEFCHGLEEQSDSSGTVVMAFGEETIGNTLPFGVLSVLDETLGLCRSLRNSQPPQGL